jgi:Mannosyl-glycoprotein endo-beta-N-acetylglucosaminidase/N-acetylmuramoyl-L-alanine amidase
MKRILVQAGHRPPLEPGHEGATGAPGEAALVAEIQAALVGLLEGDRRFEPVPVPGRIPPGLDVDAAIFLHADGATSPQASGYCFGYPLFPVNKRLADLIAAEIDLLPGHPPRRTDNYTVNLAGYYGFRRVVTDGPEVVVEHGFVTNPGEREWLCGHVASLAAAEYAAVCRFFGLEPRRGTSPGSRVTVRSRLLAPPRANLAQVQRHLTARPAGAYTPADVRRIARRYFDAAVPIGLDPLLAAAQMALETGHLTSHWSQPPRRNPAGIGVTGQPGAGVSFPDWRSAVRAHVGRLLAYALPAGRENDAQRALIEEALGWRPLPDRYRGIAPNLTGLAGTWAVDPEYAGKVRRIANAIQEA